MKTRALAWCVLLTCTALLALTALTACAHAIHVYIGGEHQHAERVERECRMKNAECRTPETRPAEDR